MTDSSMATDAINMLTGLLNEKGSSYTVKLMNSGVTFTILVVPSNKRWTYDPAQRADIDLLGLASPWAAYAYQPPADVLVTSPAGIPYQISGFTPRIVEDVPVAMRLQLRAA